MKIINLHRGQGKSTFLIMESSFNQKPIICASEFNKKNLMEKANRMGFTIPEPITIHELMHNKGQKNTFLIDELGMVLNVLFKELDIDVDIAMMTAYNTETEDFEKRK